MREVHCAKQMCSTQLSHHSAGVSADQEEKMKQIRSTLVSTPATQSYKSKAWSNAWSKSDFLAPVQQKICLQKYPKRHRRQLSVKKPEKSNKKRLSCGTTHALWFSFLKTIQARICTLQHDKICSVCMGGIPSKVETMKTYCSLDSEFS